MDWQTAKISALLSANFSKSEFFTDQDLLLEKDLPRKAGTKERFEYSPLGSELKSETDIANQNQKQNQGLDIKTELSLWIW